MTIRKKLFWTNTFMVLLAMIFMIVGYNLFC